MTLLGKILHSRSLVIVVHKFKQYHALIGIISVVDAYEPYPTRSHSTFGQGLLMPTRIRWDSNLHGNSSLGPLYTWLGARPSTGPPDSCAIKPSIRPNFINFCGANLLTRKVTRPDSRSRCSWGESVVKGINLLWIDNGNVHYPTNDPNLAHVESSSRRKARPEFFKQTQWFDAKIVPLMTPHGMSECSGRSLL